MQSHARIVADARDGRTRLTHLAGDGALTVRPTPTEGRTRVHLVAGAFGPIGGDELRLEIAVGPGATLEIAGVAATVVLRSRDARASRMDVAVDLGEGARLLLALPPTVVAAGARHTVEVELALASGAGLVLREETIRGRTNEAGGEARLITRLDLAGRPVIRQELALCGEVGGPWRPRAVGTLLLIGQDRPEPIPAITPAKPTDASGSCRSAWLTLPAAAGYQFTAMSEDPLALSQLLDAQLLKAQLLDGQLPR